jgi:hypothetical protein
MALQKMAREMKVESLTFIERPLSFGCCVCPLDGSKCEEEKSRYGKQAAFLFDCYGALMRWLFWEADNE